MRLLHAALRNTSLRRGTSQWTSERQADGGAGFELGSRSGAMSPRSACSFIPTLPLSREWPWRFSWLRGVFLPVHRIVADCDSDTVDNQHPGSPSLPERLKLENPIRERNTQ